MSIRQIQTEKGFTLVELLVGMSLALLVMAAVLSTYVSITRNFTRSLGITSANQPDLASQNRRTLAAFAQDVRMASAIATITSPASPSATTVTFTLPTGTGTKNVSYYFNTGTSDTSSITLSGYSVIVPKQSLVRVDGATGAMLVLQSSLVTSGTNGLSYYDISGTAYSSSDLTAGNYLPGIKMLSLSFATQAGNSTTGTLTQVYQTDSPRLLLRNKALLQ